MKKINLKEIVSNLTRSELNRIMAGSGDINNNNKIVGCQCDWKNLSVINNSNDASLCKCVCY